MTMVTKTANIIDEGIKNMMAAAKEDYEKWSTEKDGSISNYGKEQLAKWDSNTKITQGKKYVKIVQEMGVFAFVMKEDEGRFKKGDVLKPAGWAKPALNSPRGNVLIGNYPIRWTGPYYLK